MVNQKAVGLKAEWVQEQTKKKINVFKLIGKLSIIIFNIIQETNNLCIIQLINGEVIQSEI